MILSHSVTEPDEGKTVKFILKERLGMSERLVKRLKYAQKIYLDKLPVYVNVPVSAGSYIEAHIDFDEVNEYIIPENIELDILYEDDSIIVVNKAPGIVVHPTAGHHSGTIANALTYRLLNKGIKSLIRPVNRLDRDTTGVVVFASNQFVQENLSIQMRSGSFKKEYIGIVHGMITDKAGTIDLPIERKPGSIMLRHVSPTGAPSVTHYEVVEHLKAATVLKFILETGRTHQIRVHCQAIGHPLIGDGLYPSIADDTEITSDAEACIASSPVIMQRQALHSYRTSFLHPLSKELLEIVAPVPRDMAEAMEILRK